MHGQPWKEKTPRQSLVEAQDEYQRAALLARRGRVAGLLLAPALTVAAAPPRPLPFVPDPAAMLAPLEDEFPAHILSGRGQDANKKPGLISDGLHCYARLKPLIPHPMADGDNRAAFDANAAKSAGQFLPSRYLQGGQHRADEQAAASIGDPTVACPVVELVAAETLLRRVPEIDVDNGSKDAVVLWPEEGAFDSCVDGDGFHLWPAFR